MTSQNIDTNIIIKVAAGSKIPAAFVSCQYKNVEKQVCFTVKPKSSERQKSAESPYGKN